MGSKGNQVSTNQTQTYTPNPFIAGYGQEALQKAGTAANAPFQQPIAPVAPFSNIQQQAINYVPSLQNFAMPYFNTGAGLLGGSAAPITGADVANYYNPMAANVMAGMQDIFGQQMRETTGSATQAAGGVGADRIGVAQANLARQQGLAGGQTLASLYQPALQAAEQQKQMMAGAGFGIAQMGPAAQATQANWVNQMLGVGGMQQQLSQQQMNALYQQQLARIAYPFQTAQYLAGIAGGLAPAMGGTTTGTGVTTYPTPSPLAQGLGLGTAGIGMFGAMGGFPSVFGPGGWNYQNRGGRVMADGGGLDDIQPPMGASAPGAMPIKGSPIPMISLQPGAGKSGPGGQWMVMHDLPMQPPGMPQNKQGQSGTAGDIAAATKFLDAMGGGEAQGGAVDPMLAGQGFQSGGELGEIFPNSLAQDANPTPMESDTGLFKPDVMPPSPPMGGGPMAGTGNLPQPDLSPPVEPMADVPVPRARPAEATFTPPLPRPRPAEPAFAERFPSQGTFGDIDPFSAEKPPLNQDQIRQEAMFAAKKYGVPVDMAMRLIQQESGFRPSATSVAGAYGPMQLMGPTAAGLGVNRFNTYENIHGGMQYLRQMYDRFGNWNDAVAAYNAGPTRVANMLAGRTNLPAETQAYLRAVRPEGSGGTSAMVAGPGAPSGGATPASLEPVPPRSPMGASDFREPYPDALQRDWGQRATRSPWMSLVKAGAQMATTVGPIGSVIGQGIKAGAGELEEQRKALTTEEAINLKAKQLHDMAEYHQQVIASGRGRGMGGYLFDRKIQAWLNLHPGDDAGALEFANGQRQLSDTQLRVQAERASMQDPTHTADEWYGYFKSGIPPGTEAPAAPKGPALTGPGSTKETAIGLPADGKLERGRWYLDPSNPGTARQWNG